MAEEMEMSEMQSVRSQNARFKRGSKMSRPLDTLRNVNWADVFRVACLVSSLVLFLGAAMGLLFTCLLSFQRDLFYPTTAAYTTTKANTLGYFGVGQLCQWNNQCPPNAYCSTTCQCPAHYYLDSSTGACTKTQTYNGACTYDYQCNKIQKLSCFSGTCSCEYNTTYWDSTYSSGGGAITGHCLKRKPHGQPASAVTECVGGSALSNTSWPFGTTVKRCYCDFTNGYYPNMVDGRCMYFGLPTNKEITNKKTCTSGSSSMQCDPYYEFCMANAGDSISRCELLPTVYVVGSTQTYATKGGYNDTCDEYYICNNFQNLVCTFSSWAGGKVGYCRCPTKYHYYNSTKGGAFGMCVYGSLYGQACNTTSQCVPDSAGFTCDYLTGASTYKICLCSSSTSTPLYDYLNEKCIALKTYNSTCSSSYECSDAYGSSPSTGIGYCGNVYGGDRSVCTCHGVYRYTSAAGKCVSRVSFGSSCSSSLDCLYNQYCDTTSGVCQCKWDQYLDSGSVCRPKAYKGDSCVSTASSACWSGSCSSNACT